MSSTMVRSFISLNLISFVLAFQIPQDVAERSIYKTPEIIMEEGYHAERHTVVTNDGYILEMHRIPFKRHVQGGAGDRPVVFLMHGLLGASNQYIALGPDFSIAYNLADAGFDVWMGNARGTRNSRFHISLDPDNREDRRQFFDFTWEDIGTIDVAAMIDYVLEKTGREKLHYIGHSQGGTVFLVLTTMKPQYNDKFASVHLLAGVGYMNYFPHVVLGGLALYTNSIYSLAQTIGVVEMFPPLSTATMETANYNVSDYCTGDVTLRDLCDLIGIPEIMNDSIMDILRGFETGGAALKQIAHYGQNIQDKLFRRWNYGSIRNLEIYGSYRSPNYDLRLITANVTMHYTVSDNLLDERDVFAMAEVMPNAVVRKVARDSFSHVDFVAAEDVKELVTDYIIDAIRNVDFPANDAEYENELYPDLTDSSSIVALSVLFKLYLFIYGLIYIVY